MPFQRVTVFPLETDADRAVLEAVARKFGQLIAQQPGHRTTCIDLDLGAGQLRSISTWQSADEAAAVNQSVRQLAQQEMTEQLTGPATTTTAEVVFESGH